MFLKNFQGVFKLKLKELNLFGFKSFADKTTIEFDKGITIIVGPNGSGKSNIFDAIKWVLGEQSVKSLRGSKMEDVIFAGSDTRKTLGMAEVSLILENEDKKIDLPYSEIKVTRRIYRSGESEYFINDNPCRLKDIVEMFMGTGIGIDSYSIISQGEVDRIINARPEERREIFEEAAGITKHRKRKEETLRKLETVEQDMVRINDILEEIKRQASSLERQAKKAEKYKILKEETETIEITISKKRIKDLSEKYEKLLSEKEIIEGKIEKENLKLKDYEDRLEKLNSEIKLREQEINDKKNAIIIKEQEIKRLEDNLNYNEERKKEMILQKEKVSREIDEAIEKKEKIKIEIENNKRQINEKKDFLMKKEEELKQDLEEVHFIEKEINEILKQKEIKINEIESINGKIIEIKNKITEQELLIKGIEENITGIEKQKQENEEKLKLIELEVENIEDKLKVKEEIIKDIKTNEESLLKKKIEYNKDLQKIDEIIKEQSIIISKIRSKYNFLKEMQEKMAGFSSIVKKVLTEFKQQLNHQEKSEIIESLNNLINVERKYVKTLEKNFSAFLQAILINKFDIIEEIFSLYEKEKGELIILHNEILNENFEKISGKWRNKISHKNIEAYLPDLITVDEKYKGVKLLFYNVFVVSNFEKAKEVLKDIKIDEQFYLLTGTDELISNFGIFKKVGSELEIGTNLLTRVQQINEMKNEILLAEQRMNSLNEERKLLNEKVLIIEKQIEELSEKYHNQYVEVIKDSEKIKQRQEERKIYFENFEKNKIDINNFIRLKNEIFKIKETLELQKGEQELILSKCRNDLQEIENIIRTKDEVKNAKKLKCENLEKEIIKERGNLDIIISNNNILEKRGEEINLELENFKKEIENLVDKIKNIENEKGNIQSNIVKIHSEISIEANHIETLNNKFGEIKNQKEELERFIKDMGKEREELKEKLTDIKINVNELGYEIKNIYNKLQEEYKVLLNEEEIKNLQIDEEQYKELNFKLEENRKKMENIGVVNLVAIEEYDSAKKRQDFLQGQYNDLVASREDLKKIIKKLNDESTVLFSDTFNKIRENFKEVFKIMMKGGDADLILIDKENILETGIEIIARPPGKKLQNISLLSGGEKAVTAISLLFAIFLIKTSPFCIMDEIDAPLDDVNIVRFIKFIKEFKNKTQFIIITHNKLTMEMGDIIYGVSMERDGVSKIISVRMDKLGEIINEN